MSMGEVPSVGVFLRDSNPYLRTLVKRNRTIKVVQSGNLLYNFRIVLPED